jgi:hypothetical protein
MRAYDFVIDKLPRGVGDHAMLFVKSSGVKISSGVAPRSETRHL